MKVISKMTLALAAATLLFVGCNESQSTTPAKSAEIAPVVTEASLGLRKTTLYAENTTSASKTEYVKAQPGTSQKFNRAFQDAPPMIPHDTTGLIPIKIGENACTGCHMPDMAAAMGATPIPVSHLTNMRPKHNFDGKIFSKSIDNMKNEVAISKPGTELIGGRYNCTQCHAPQSQGNLAVENTFTPVYSDANGAHRSGWKGSRMTDYLDTIEGEGDKVTAADIANENSPAGESVWKDHH